MNADDLKKLPKFIDGGGDGNMWQVPSIYPISDFETVYIRLADVEALFSRHKEIEDML